MSVFRVMRLSRTFRSFSTESYEIKKVGMVGLGLMGHGIAQTAAASGYEVVAMDQSPKAVDKGVSDIRSSLEKMLAKSIQKGKIDADSGNKDLELTMDRIQPSTSMDDLADCDLVIEAIVENQDIKKHFYEKLGEIVKPSGILASNTSSLPIQLMAEASKRPSQVIGLHFFNPVQLMKLVEIVSTDVTDPQVLTEAKSWVQSINKVAVSCKDTPGFIVNRLLVPNLVQALLMLERGDASQEDIDLSMQYGAGHPMGPITLADYVGLDTILSITEGWVDNFPNEPAFVVPESLREKVKLGHLGRKTGQGFYQWQGDKRV